MFELIVLIVSALLNVLLGIVVYSKNPASATNKLFFVLTGSFAGWSIVNYISVHPVALSQLWWIRLVLFFATFLCLSVYLTFNVFPHYTLPPSRWGRKLAIVAALVAMPLTLTPLVFKGLETSSGTPKPIPNVGIPIFAFTVIGLLVGGVVTLVKKYRRSFGTQKRQIRFVLLGLAGAFSLILITDFLFVILFNYTKLVPLGPAYTLIFSGSLAYAIVKHKLFDIRAAAARTLAYLLSLGFIGVIYGIVAFGLTQIFSGGAHLDNFQRFLFVGFALITAVVYRPIKLFFDRLTTKIFYQDAYDPQLFIDQLNKIFVSSAELDKLLAQTNQVIEANIKSEYSTFLINKTSYDPDRWIGNKPFSFDATDIEKLKERITETKDKVIATDDLEGHRELHKLLFDHNIGVVAQLVPTLDQELPGIGFLVLGPKKSGNAYSRQDKQVVEIIANELVIAVENALRFEEIEKFNVTLQEKVDKATAELKHTNQKLRDLDDAKDEFISMASHQLRTPLTSMKGYVSMVLEGDSGKINTMQRKLLDQAFVSSQRMVYLIADLLNVSRLKTGKFIIEATPTNLAEVVEQEISQLVETAKGRNLALTYDKPKKFPMLMLDETKIRQVIMNFADNAIYYTPSGGHIKINLVDKGSTIEFTVVDDGLGVPREEQHHLFNKFYRAQNAQKARPDGTGLGLFMAKKVIIAQGGAIIFHSVEGKGSTFGFSFAKSKLKPTAEQLKNAENSNTGTATPGPSLSSPSIPAPAVAKSTPTEPKAEPEKSKTTSKP